MTKEGLEVAVVGAGYAGLTAALRLWRKGHRHGIRVTLIAPNRTFNEQIRMQDAATGDIPAPLGISQVISGTSIRFLRSRLAGLDAGVRTRVRLEGGEVVEFDRVILALGWDFGPDSSALPGEFWPAPHPVHGAEPCAARLAALPSGAAVAVVGGGTTGVELAGAVATARSDVRVVLVSAGRAAAFKGPRIERLIRSRLGAKGVTIVDGVRAAVVHDGGNSLRIPALDDHFDMVLHASGGKAPRLLSELGLPRDARGAILVDSDLRSPGNPSVFAAGDCIALSEPPATPFRRSAYTALATGAHAADNVLREHLGKSARPFGFAWYGQGISLGRRDGVGFTAFPGDRPVGPVFTGVPAWYLRNAFVAALRQLVLAQKRIPWILWWFPRHGVAQTRDERRRLPLRRID